MGKGGGGGTTGAGRMAEEIGFNVMRSGAKSRKLVFSQLGEALKSGNIESRIPIIQSMVEGGLQQGSGALRMAEADIAKSGTGRSPVAKEQMAQLRAMAANAVSQIPSEVIGQTVRSAPETLSGATNAALGLLGSAQMAQSSNQQARAQAQAAQNANIGAGASAAAGIAVAVIAAI